MAITRYFLDWDAPLTEKLRSFLVRESVSGIVDLSGFEIIVPTRQSGRRLREHLALFCAEEGSALFAPRVVTPQAFLDADDASSVANQTVVQAVWTELLLKVDMARLQGLFPASAPTQDLKWAMATASVIQDLRTTLVEGSYSIASVLTTFGMDMPEPDRWQDLAYLEEAYLHSLEKRALKDPCAAMLRCAEGFKIRSATKDVLVAGVSDCPKLLEKTLGGISDDVRVSILIHAPQSLADEFDEWGRPIPEKWCDRVVPVEEPEKNIVLAGSPLAQSRDVLAVMADEAERYGPLDVAIGVPDPGVVPYLTAELGARHLVSYDPSGIQLSEHRLFHLLENVQRLIEEPSYRALADTLRHPDILKVLDEKHGVSGGSLLTELDQFQNYYLPLAASDVITRLERVNVASEDSPFANLAVGVRWINQQLGELNSNQLPDALKNLLQCIYDVEQVDPQTREGDTFIQVASHIMSALDEMTGDGVQSLGLPAHALFELFVSRLRDQKTYADRAETMIDLEGWLELPWNDAPLLVVTGMNDGFVPDGSVGDMFLPDSTLKKLELRHDLARHARDTLIMCSLIESRRETGRVCFISGKVSGTGDPLKPSRLLFHAPEEELPVRARQLFGDPDEKRESHASSVSFKLKPDEHLKIPETKSLSVTAFRNYLACPFRYFLSRVLRMESINDGKVEMDAMDFGSMVHAALGSLANSELKLSNDEAALRSFFWKHADDWVTRRFSVSHPLQVRIQLEAAKQRLAAAARIHASLVEEGWEIVAAECAATAMIDGVEVRGRVDRIDRHRETGVIRILDYKSSDTADTPGKAHWGAPLDDAEPYSLLQVGKGQKRWRDLQLPLYQLMLAPDWDFSSGVELGYFNLPKAVGDSGVRVWDAIEESHKSAANVCAEGIVRDIVKCRFWPPRSVAKYDPFEAFYNRDLLSVVDENAFRKFLENAAGAPRSVATEVNA